MSPRSSFDKPFGCAQDRLRMSGGRQAQDERDAVCGKEPRGYVSSGSSHRQIVRVISSGASMPSRTRKRLGSCSAIAR